jgi:hypothetical protein
MFMTDPDADRILATLRDEIISGNTLQESSQRAMDCFRKKFADSVVLVRTYATVPYDVLPARDRFFVQTVAENQKQVSLLNRNTPVLSLLGTAGIEQAWGDRYSSKSHLAIPFLSEEFVSGIPMVAGLVGQLGVSTGRVARLSGAANREEDFGAFAESFFVRDAALSRDSSGRLLIPAQDFVREYEVRTVLGVGGQFSATGMSLVCVIFSRETLSQTPAWLLRLPLLLGTATRPLVSAGKVYDAD